VCSERASRSLGTWLADGSGMHTHRSLAAALLSLSLVAPAVASAEDEAVPVVSEHRFEVVGPSFGIGHFAAPSSDYSRGIATLAVDARYAHASGHGVMARYAYGTNVWGEGSGIELDYLYRAILAGHQDVSLGLDFTLGPTAAWLEHDEQTLATGMHLGGNAGVSLDFRAFNFVLSLGGQYRLLIPTDARLDGGPAGPAHAITGTLGAGFTFY
jgi:hypothetical protein